MIIFTKLGWDDIPEQVRQRVTSWSEKQVDFDDTGLTQTQKDKVTAFMKQLGYS